MKASSLENKTIRPGSLNGFAYYHSDRHPSGSAAAVKSPKTTAKPKRSSLKAKLIILAVVLLGLGWFFFIRGDNGTAGKTTASNSPASKSAPAAATTSKANNKCASNTEDKFILVSVSQRHLWACNGSKTAYDTPVITGIQIHESTLTPVGTYHIYAKVADTTLTGTDETGSWSDPVQFWMPFLDNQFGTYGFHDATWRPDKEFGHIDPTSEKASHGCVELPLASAKWLYGWAEVGTTVTVES